MTWPYYVYEIERHGQPIYVGKGRGARLNVSARIRGGRPVVIAMFKHEEHALQFEKERIADRLKQGHRLLNVVHGNIIPWQRRTDTQAWAKELMAEFAQRFAHWIKAGRVDDLSTMINMDKKQIIRIYQKFGY